jgi:hypothetical protein
VLGGGLLAGRLVGHRRPQEGGELAGDGDVDEGGALAVGGEIPLASVYHEDTLVETIEWYREREPLRLRPPGTRQPLSLRLAGLGVRSATGVVARITP